MPRLQPRRRATPGRRAAVHEVGEWTTHTRRRTEAGRLGGRERDRQWTSVRSSRARDETTTRRRAHPRARVIEGAATTGSQQQRAIFEEAARWGRTSRGGPTRGLVTRDEPGAGEHRARRRHGDAREVLGALGHGRARRGVGVARGAARGPTCDRPLPLRRRSVLLGARAARLRRTASVHTPSTRARQQQGEHERARGGQPQGPTDTRCEALRHCATTCRTCMGLSMWVRGAAARTRAVASRVRGRLRTSQGLERTLHHLWP